jgi:hypothetical protein
LPVPGLAEPEWLDDGHHKFHELPPQRPGLRRAGPGSINKASPREVSSPPASNAGAKDSNGVPSRRPKCAELEEFQRETGKFGRTDLIEMPTSGGERPMAFASGGHEFRISRLRRVPALSIRRLLVVILRRSRLARAGTEPALLQGF